MSIFEMTVCCEHVLSNDKLSVVLSEIILRDYFKESFWESF